MGFLKAQGFSEEDNEGRKSTALRHDGNGIDCYVIQAGPRKARLLFRTPNSSYGIDPDYLDSFVNGLKAAGFVVSEVPGAKRLYEAKPYDFSNSPGRELLAGYQPPQPIP